MQERAVLILIGDWHLRCRAVDDLGNLLGRSARVVGMDGRCPDQLCGRLTRPGLRAGSRPLRCGHAWFARDALADVDRFRAWQS